MSPTPSRATARHGQALLVFDPADGRTINSYPLPEATGFPVGVSIGNGRRVVTATSDGQVYGFAPLKSQHRRHRSPAAPSPRPGPRTPGTSRPG